MIVEEEIAKEERAMKSVVWVFVCVFCVIFTFLVWGCEGGLPSTKESPPIEFQGVESVADIFSEQVALDAGPKDGEVVNEVAPPSEKPDPREEKVEEREPSEKSPEQPLDGPLEPWKDSVIHQGKATYYDADGSGNCSFPAVSPPMVAAMNEQEYGMAVYCGACVKVDGPKGSVLVRITDRCPECLKGHLDLSREAFAKIGDPVQGVIAIKWQVVSCPQEGPMRYHYKDGSSQWWTAIQVRDHRLPIKQVELFKNNQWQVLPRERYNYFLDAKGAGAQPLRLRLTATNGQTIEETLPPPASDLLVTGKQQFVP